MYSTLCSQFDAYAMAIIDRCFENDVYFAVDLLKQPAVAFANADPLQLAEEANCRAFLASKCVQTHLDNKWFGNINYKRPAITFRVTTGRLPRLNGLLCSLSSRCFSVPCSFH